MISYEMLVEVLLIIAFVLFLMSPLVDKLFVLIYRLRTPKSQSIRGLGKGLAGFSALSVGEGLKLIGKPSDLEIPRFSDKNPFGRNLSFRDPRSEFESRRTIERKKALFINIPNVSFHFVIEPEIRDSYNDYFKEPTIANLVSEITGEIEGGLGGNIPQVIEAHIGSKDISKWVSTIKVPDLSLSGMFLRYQEAIIEKEQVVLGIEEVDIELDELQEFDETISELETQYEFKIEQTLIDAKRQTLKAKAAEKTLVKLETVKGVVLIEGKFKIEDSPEFYKCVYIHPVNEYLVDEQKIITISVLIPKDDLENHIKANYAASISELIPLKIYGRIWKPIDRKSGVWNLQVTPVAIY